MWRKSSRKRTWSDSHSASGVVFATRRQKSSGGPANSRRAQACDSGNSNVPSRPGLGMKAMAGSPSRKDGGCIQTRTRSGGNSAGQGIVAVTKSSGKMRTLSGIPSPCRTIDLPPSSPTTNLARSSNGSPILCRGRRRQRPPRGAVPLPRRRGQSRPGRSPPQRRRSSRRQRRIGRIRQRRPGPALRGEANQPTVTGRPLDARDPNARLADEVADSEPVESRRCRSPEDLRPGDH